MVRVDEPHFPVGGCFSIDPPFLNLMRLAQQLPSVPVSLMSGGRWADSVDRSNCWTIATVNGPLAKHYSCRYGRWLKQTSFPNYTAWRFGEAKVQSHEQMVELLSVLQSRESFCLIRATPDESGDQCEWQYRRWREDFRRSPANNTGGNLIDTPKCWLIVDVDEIRIPIGLEYDRPDLIVGWLVDDVLPEPFKNVTCTWQASGSAGLLSGVDGPKAKFHLFFRASEPIECRAFHELLGSAEFSMIDRACAVGTQPIFTSAPVLSGGDDPLPRRVGIHFGDHDEADIGAVLDDVQQRQEEKHLATMAAQRAARELVTEGTVLAYDKAWLRIAYNDLGAHSNGYRSPIFQMISVAIRSGENNFETMKTRLRFLVESRCRELGDRHKLEDIARYLSDSELDEAIQSSLRYWRAVT